ncbi:hypothetical protein D3C78_1695860 [compost metagenome]
MVMIGLTWICRFLTFLSSAASIAVTSGSRSTPPDSSAALADAESGITSKRTLSTNACLLPVYPSASASARGE